MEQEDIRLSRRVFGKHQKEIKKLKEFVKHISKVLEEKIISVILIGSRARLDFNIGSDIDLLIVGNWEKTVFFNRISEIADRLSLPMLPIDFFLYTPEEIHELIEKGNPLVLDGFTEGVCLYNPSYYNKIHKKIKNQISEGRLSKSQNIWKIK